MRGGLSILFDDNMATFPRIPYNSKIPFFHPTQLKQAQRLVVGQGQSIVNNTGSGAGLFFIQDLNLASDASPRYKIMYCTRLMWNSIHKIFSQKKRLQGASVLQDLLLSGRNVCCGWSLGTSNTSCFDLDLALLGHLGFLGQFVCYCKASITDGDT